MQNNINHLDTTASFPTTMEPVMTNFFNTLALRQYTFDSNNLALQQAMDELNNTEFDGTTLSNSLFRLHDSKFEESKELLDSGRLDMNFRTENGNDLLSYLFANEHKKLLNYVIETHLDKFYDETLVSFLNLMFNIQTTKLGSSQLDFVSKILSKKPKQFINFQDKHRNSVIMNLHSNIGFVEYILKNNFNVDLMLQNFVGFNVLMICTKENNILGLVKLLKYAKTKYDNRELNTLMNQQNKSGDTVLSIACRLSDYKCVELLLKFGYSDLNMVDNLGNTCLHHAIERNHNTILKLLIQYDMNLDIKNKLGLSLLTKAIQKQYYDIVLELLKHKIDVNVSDVFAVSLLQHMIALKYTKEEKDNQKNKLDRVSQARNIGAPVDADTVFTNLFIGYFNKSNNDIFTSMIYELLDKNVNINTTDMRDMTPLTMVCDNYDVELFNILINHPSFDVNYKDGKYLRHVQAMKDKLMAELNGDVCECPENTGMDEELYQNARMSFNPMMRRLPTRPNMNQQPLVIPEEKIKHLEAVNYFVKQLSEKKINPKLCNVV